MTAQEIKILVVDDDNYILSLIQDILELEGYQVILARNGAAALQKFFEKSPTLVLLDLMLPDIDGYTVCRQIRESSPVPIIMVTARGKEDEKIEGFEAGADDYITKPFSTRELVARVGAVLRRTYFSDKTPVNSSNKSRSFRCKDLYIDFELNTVTLNNNIVDLTTTEYRLLSYLARNPGKILTPEEILQSVWGREYENEYHMLRVNIARLRNKLKDDARKAKYIETRPGQGYLMNQEID